MLRLDIRLNRHHIREEHKHIPTTPTTPLALQIRQGHSVRKGRHLTPQRPTLRTQHSRRRKRAYTKLYRRRLNYHFRRRDSTSTSLATSTLQESNKLLPIPDVVLRSIIRQRRKILLRQLRIRLPKRTKPHHEPLHLLLLTQHNTETRCSTARSMFQRRRPLFPTLRLFRTRHNPEDP